MATTVMGQAISMPVIISPTGVQAVHPDGEVAVARAVEQQRGITDRALSSFASKPMEAVVEANPNTLVPDVLVGWPRPVIGAAAQERAKAAGREGHHPHPSTGPFSNGRDWGRPV